MEATQRDYGAVETPAALARSFTERGWWSQRGVLDAWEEAVAASPTKVAVVDRSGRSYTYEQADGASSRLATWLLSKGVAPGDIVPVQLPSRAEFLVVFVAVLKAGCAINPLSANLRARECVDAYYVQGSRVGVFAAHYRRTSYGALIREIRRRSPLREALVVGESGETAGGEAFADAVRGCEPLPRNRWARRGGQDIAAVMFTSGSEARPKGVLLTHNNVIASERAFAMSLGLGADDVMLMPAPLGHATGFLHGIVMPIVTGGTSVLCDLLEGDEMARMAAAHGATCAMSVPGVIDALLCACGRNRGALASLRVLCCGGSPVPRPLLERARLMGVRLHSVYGATESAPHTMTRASDPDDRVYQTDGRACPGVEVRIVDPVTRRPLPPGVEGEEASRGPQVFAGYLGRPDLTRRVVDDDGWYYSGDLAVMDGEGFVRITGRIKDIIIRGGENISPTEVEQVLVTHPAIAQACVVPVPDPVLGERALSYLVLRPGAPPVGVDDLVRYFVECGVAKYKIPEHVRLVDALPVLPSGKVDRRGLKDRALSEFSG